jgi:hypothetical protein
MMTHAQRCFRHAAVDGTSTRKLYWHCSLRTFKRVQQISYFIRDLRFNSEVWIISGCELPKGAQGLLFTIYIGHLISRYLRQKSSLLTIRQSLREMGKLPILGIRPLLGG